LSRSSCNRLDHKPAGRRCPAEPRSIHPQRVDSVIDPTNLPRLARAERTSVPRKNSPSDHASACIRWANGAARVPPPTSSRSNACAIFVHATSAATGGEHSLKCERPPSFAGAVASLVLFICGMLAVKSAVGLLAASRRPGPSRRSRLASLSPDPSVLGRVFFLSVDAGFVAG
jgi:hypothetical protein